MSLRDLTVDDFKPAVGGKFTLTAEGIEPLELELLSADTFPPGSPTTDESGKRTPFSLSFLGPREPILGQHVYRLEHESVGAIEVFVVPNASDERGTRYGVVFA